MKAIQKILIANRGEIALRVMKSVKEMGIKTVAIFSEADRNMSFVAFADEAICIGPVESAKSYLNIQKIVEVCKQLKVDAVHPGYGFLSENADFATALEENNIKLIGPRASSIKTMGDKLLAKEAVSVHNIPLVPGSNGALRNKEEAIQVASDIGYPIMLKASGGGGGKGMRILRSEKELVEQYEVTISEAEKAFGDGKVFIEKFIESPKHIEFQVLADEHGNTFHLFERDCSVQRRHQKVVEEAPSVFLTPELRAEMGACAVNVAKACNYQGAGTVEFIMDESKNFYFLEMNTRLQVEHPVTELITGLDLVKEQVKIARGEKLAWVQEDIAFNGYAMEVRVYAEDSSNNFLPDSGKLEVYKTPSGPGIRVDDGFKEGDEVSIFYDPMLSKLITYGSTREEAIYRMIQAISDYKIIGVETTLEFCGFVMQHPDFREGNFDTNFVAKHIDQFNQEKEFSEDELLIASILSTNVFRTKSSVKTVSSSKSAGSNWKKNRL